MLKKNEAPGFPVYGISLNNKNIEGQLLKQ